MRWREGRKSTNVEDRRGGGRVSGGMKLGGGAIILALLASFLLGEDPSQILNQLGGASVQTQQQTTAQNDETSEFVARILGDSEDAWGKIFKNAGERYPAPTLVLYTDMTDTACGLGQATSGPFYCPGDQKVYLDLGFLNELKRLGAPGDFAFAYVIAHEVGHHIQRVTGTEQEVRRLQSRASQRQANDLSVRLELQADCYAGIWANHSKIPLEKGDIEEGFRAAAAVGDDRLQQMSGRGVHPETFTHGSSAQRMEWFKRGLETGSIQNCNTFN